MSAQPQFQQVFTFQVEPDGLSEILHGFVQGLALRHHRQVETLGHISQFIAWIVYLGAILASFCCLLLTFCTNTRLMTPLYSDLSKQKTGWGKRLPKPRPARF